MKRALVVGGDGLLGTAVAGELKRRGAAVTETTRRPSTVDGWVTLDLERPDDWPRIEPVDAVFLCAAETSIARCAADPARTHAINVRHTAHLADICLDAGAFVLVPSTNAVFDGTRPRRTIDEAVCPVTAYGRQKAELEAHVLAAGRAAVLRLTKVFGPWPALFAGWRDAFAARQKITAFRDLVLAPVTAHLAAQVLVDLAWSRAAGLFQLSADRDVSYVDIARHLARRLGAAPELITAASIANAGIDPHAAPQHTTLDVGVLASRFGVVAPDPWAVIDSVTIS